MKKDYRRAGSKLLNTHPRGRYVLQLACEVILFLESEQPHKIPLATAKKLKARSSLKRQPNPVMLEPVQ